MTIKKWKITGQKLLVETPIFSLFEHQGQSQIDEQKKGRFFHFKAPGWVNVIAITPDQKVIVVEQYRHGNDSISLEVPGGLIDAGEEPLAAGLRELKEESGGVGTNAKVIGVVDANPAIQNNSCWTVLVENVEIQEQELDELEEITIHLVDLKDIPEMIRSGRIRHSLVVVAFHHLYLWKTRNR